jgi:hypothetical protein
MMNRVAGGMDANVSAARPDAMLYGVGTGLGGYMAGKKYFLVILASPDPPFPRKITKITNFIVFLCRIRGYIPLNGGFVCYLVILLVIFSSHLLSRVASHLFTGGFAGIGKLPALFGWYIRYGIWY